MKIHEYQAKQVMAARGIPVPLGRMATTVDEAVAAVRPLIEESGNPVVVLKAQIHAGGRGKGTLAEHPDVRGVNVVTDAVENRGFAPAGGSTNRYYLSADTSRSAGDKLLTGSRDVPGLGPGAVSAGSAIVSVPNSTQADTYFLLVCADAGSKVTESDEGNNCAASSTTIQIQ